VERVAERSVVGDDEEAGDALRPGGGADLVDQREQDVVSAAPTGVTDRDSRRDPLAAHPGLGWAIEHELDSDAGRDRGPQPSDERRLRCPRRPAGEGMQQVRPIDEQAIGCDERVARSGHVPIVRVRWDEAPGPRLRSAA
jgi:hypothetical protein